MIPYDMGYKMAYSVFEVIKDMSNLKWIPELNPYLIPWNPWTEIRKQDEVMKTKIYAQKLLPVTLTFKTPKFQSMIYASLIFKSKQIYLLFRSNYRELM